MPDMDINFGAINDDMLRAKQDAQAARTPEEQNALLAYQKAQGDAMIKALEAQSHTGISGFLGILSAMMMPYLAPMVGGALGVGPTLAKALVSAGGGALGGGIDHGGQGALLGALGGGVGSLGGSLASHLLGSVGGGLGGLGDGLTGGGGVGSLAGGIGADTLGASLPGTVSELVINGALKPSLGTLLTGAAGGLGAGLGAVGAGGGAPKPLAPGETEVSPLTVMGGGDPSSWLQTVLGAVPATIPTQIDNLHESSYGPAQAGKGLTEDGNGNPINQPTDFDTLGGILGSMYGPLTAPHPGGGLVNDMGGAQPTGGGGGTATAPGGGGTGGMGTGQGGGLASQGGAGAATGGGGAAPGLANLGGAGAPGFAAPAPVAELEGSLAPDIYPWRKAA